MGVVKKPLTIVKGKNVWKQFWLLFLNYNMIFYCVVLFLLINTCCLKTLISFTSVDFLFFRHVKDIIILTAGCQLLSSVISTYFWWLWLLAPFRGFWILWKNVLAPYIFEPAPASTEVSEKKQKKLERRMRRQHWRL